MAMFRLQNSIVSVSIQVDKKNRIHANVYCVRLSMVNHNGHATGGAEKTQDPVEI